MQLVTLRRLLTGQNQSEVFKVALDSVQPLLVQVTLGLTVSQSVHLGVDTLVGLGQILICSQTITVLVVMGHPL